MHSVFFFFNDTATTEIYTLSLHDALPISWEGTVLDSGIDRKVVTKSGSYFSFGDERLGQGRQRSEEHTSELQSRLHLVCRLLLEKKKSNIANRRSYLDSWIQRQSYEPIAT